MGVATLSATVLALAPGYVAVTCTVGGATSGYCAIGSCTSATPPTIRMTIDSTEAKIGRSMKKWEITITPPRRALLAARRYCLLLRRCHRLRRLRRGTNRVDGVMHARHLNALRDDPTVRRDAALGISCLLADHATAVVEQL